ncbi:hypothetical protein JTB14_015063 [Gonioctena quinquepunctata]|nr:hypothetical protein JTB14_015063 [Gonioctena quinquepunctata]
MSRGKKILDLLQKPSCGLGDQENERLYTSTDENQSSPSQTSNIPHKKSPSSNRRIFDNQDKSNSYHSLNNISDIAPETESQINRGESKKIIKVLQDIDLNSPMLDTLFSKQSISESTKADDQKLYGKNENDDEANGYYSDEEPFSPDYSEYVPDSDEFGSDSENDTSKIIISTFNSASDSSGEIVTVDHSKKKRNSNMLSESEMCEIDTNSMNPIPKFTSPQRIKTAPKPPEVISSDIKQNKKKNGQNSNVYQIYVISVRHQF